MDDNDKNDKQVHDAEVISSSQDGGRGRPYVNTVYMRVESDGSGSGFGRNRMGFGSVWGTGFGLPSSSTELAVCRGITLGLILTCLIQWGFLAALGFVFFYTIFSVLGVFVGMSRVLQGHIPSPWPWRIGNWVVSMLLISWLV